MGYFLATFLFMLVVIAVMAVGVIFGRHAIKGSCGGTGNCLCEEKCDKRKKLEAEQQSEQTIVLDSKIKI
ncbi:MAG: (Na+)-NQR maturation NqrM [Methylomonas sp.]|uniref:(Na+)-NQR maturation NqrM n=1 Tax=Methylomonas sp. TaxID=418 RepID=UPI0025DE345B|nr:(Na+)-NQR maturation NqrM [Methylomonas sp.]MCK9606789.1 (Na+)-NQR maturation NqrM [Methylomonas sp.]